MGKKGKSGAWDGHTHTLLYTSQVTDKDLLCNTGEVLNILTIYTGKESKKRTNIRIHITESLCYTSETNIICKFTILQKN